MPDWTTSELRDGLSTPLGDARFTQPDIAVEAVVLAEDGRSLLVDVRVPSASGPRRWRLTLTDAYVHLRDASSASATLIVRSHIEEWWFTKDHEPESAAMAVPLDR